MASGHFSFFICLVFKSRLSLEVFGIIDVMFILVTNEKLDGKDINDY